MEAFLIEQCSPYPLESLVRLTWEVCKLRYLGRSELSAEKFVSDPFGAGKLYKTGDLGRFRPYGVMEFVGRANQQVKLRGFRIELGEIEAVLKKHPAVRNCALVVCRNQDESGKGLVAYLVTEEVSPDELVNTLTKAFQNIWFQWRLSFSASCQLQATASSI
jgi:microcystin synthetase protein McyA